MAFGAGVIGGCLVVSLLIVSQLFWVGEAHVLSDPPAGKAPIAATLLSEDMYERNSAALDRSAFRPAADATFYDLPLQEKLILIDSKYEASGTEVVSLVIVASGDEDLRVRDAALDLATVLSPGDYESLLGRLLDSMFPDVRLSAAEELGSLGTKGALEILLPRLRDADPEVADEVYAAFEFWSDADFEGPDDIFAWWQTNKVRFNDEMELIEP